MKYVMFKQKLGHTTRLVPVIFPNSFVHADVADALKALPGLEGAVPVSAGECGLEVDYTADESSTLGLKALPSDASVITRYDYFHGLIEEEEEETTE